MFKAKRNTTDTAETKQKKKLSKPALLLLIGVIIILIPCLVFGYILLSSALQTGTPQIGSRFKNDLNPSITSSDEKDLESQIKKIDGVESVDVVLKTAQLRVNVNTNDSLTEEQISAMVEDVYKVVVDKLPSSKYFTEHDGMKMYDLAISVYNFTGNDNGDMIYYLLTKNSTMETPVVETPHKPKDAELAKELRGETADSETPENGTVTQ